ncbi:PH-like domain-containing protein [Rathayibacter sp. CAU 1779]
MDKLWPTLLILVVLVLVFLGMWLGWRRRARRDSALEVPTVLEDAGTTLVTVQALHVATTYHDKPLDRVVVAGLAFRSTASVTVSDGGVTLTAPGESSVAIAASAILGAGAATWTIDRTVERDGLLMIAWRTVPADAEGPVLDTYLRVTDPDERRRLVAGIRSISTTTDGADDVATDETTDKTTGSEA